MAIIVIKNLHGKQIHTGNVTKTLLASVHEAYIDWMHACGGKGRCTTCKFRVVAGAEHVGPLTDAEQRYRDKGALRADERLACQALIQGDVTVAVPDESKFPHMNYSE